MVLGFFFGACNQNDELEVNETSIQENSSKKNGWVSLTDSKQSAVSYLNNLSNNKAKNTDIPKFTERDIQETIGIQDVNDNTLIYIHNLKQGGFVAMSGSIYEVPILAYSTESEFDYENLPDDLSLWFFIGSKKISYLQEKQSSYKQDLGWSNELGLADQWGNFIPTPIFDVTILDEYDQSISGPLLNTLWGQGIGFNTYAPNLGCTGDTRRGSNAWGGCVAVAMGQIMKFHQAPNNYNWTSMPDRLFRSGSNLNVGAQNQFPGQHNLAWMLRQLGNQLGASWGCEATGASSDNVKGVFNANNYQASSQLDYHFEYVKAQTELNRLAYISGSNQRVTNYVISWKVFGTKIKAFHYYTYKGHAWVADGAKEHVVVSKTVERDTDREWIRTNVSKYIHFNWGWTESNMTGPKPTNCNGWYYYDLFYPGYDTDENNLINYEDDYIHSVDPYNMRREIIINIMPN